MTEKWEKQLLAVKEIMLEEKRLHNNVVESIERLIDENPTSEKRILEWIHEVISENDLHYNI
ncbi:MAG: hypothetical protein U0L34_06610 [Paludibacteraceae bacterium]|nr:hypothetical protein [Paludibacteraceae bacterium]